jgi:D-alanyl-D-alanine dipeptidase
VRDPRTGSYHERGVAIDLGLAALDGAPVPLPSGHDEFGARSKASAPLEDGGALRNRELLRAAMEAAGFRVNPKEWWHYSRLWGGRWPISS